MTIKAGDKFTAPIPGVVTYVGRVNYDVQFDGSPQRNSIDKGWFEKTFTVAPVPIKAGDTIKYLNQTRTYVCMYIDEYCLVYKEPENSGNSRCRWLSTGIENWSHA